MGPVGIELVEGTHDSPLCHMHKPLPARAGSQPRGRCELV